LKKIKKKTGEIEDKEYTDKRAKHITTKDKNG